MTGADSAEPTAVTMSDDFLAALSKHVDHLRTPNPTDSVYKDQCIYTHDTPQSSSGLFVCMNSFLGLARDRVDSYSQRTGRCVFLHMRCVREQQPHPEAAARVESEGTDEPEAKVTRLAIGVEGGFQVASGSCADHYRLQLAVVILPQWSTAAIPWLGSSAAVAPASTGPGSLRQLEHVLREQWAWPAAAVESVVGIVSADSADTRRLLAAQTAGTWDGEARAVSRHASSLQQLDNGVRVPPHGWQCQLCDKTDNLWLNLTCGTILCGRRFFDGSGGNNHALEYFRQTGYPLAVKLGTISSDGGADVFSYAEDDMVEDPLLDKHLEHFGIRAASMRKTDKSMAELEIAINQRVGEWATIQEQGHQLVPVYGPGYTGLRNLGNSCYMNAVMQAVFAVPSFERFYYDPAETVFSQLSPEQVVDDFNAQMCKLAQGLLSGRYSQAPDKQNKTAAAAAADGAADDSAASSAIDPSSFRAVVSRGHADFASRRQQDAQEFFLHLINLIERHSRAGQANGTGQEGGAPQNPASVFKHRVEERLECGESGCVRYSYRTEYCLALPVPVEAAVNHEAVREYETRKAEALASSKDGVPVSSDQTAAVGADLCVVRPEIPFSACLSALAEPRTIDRFFSSAVQRHTSARQSCRLATMPHWLLIQLQKFTVGDDWLPRKLDVTVDMPDQLDLEQLRASGLQPGEKLLPEVTTAAAAAATVEIDSAVVAQLVDMGFPESACRRAVYSTSNSGVEPATNWIMEHMTDSDFADPFTVPGTVQSSSAAAPPSVQAEPSAESLQMIEAMGFTRPQATRALRQTDNNVERAIDWIFSHQDELDSTEAPSSAAPSAGTDANHQFDDGPARYQLVAFISHMGTSSEVGHYVCHVRREGRWCIYNDEKVAESRQPPRNLAYLYLYRRCSQ